MKHIRKKGEKKGDLTLSQVITAIIYLITAALVISFVFKYAEEFKKGTKQPFLEAMSKSTALAKNLFESVLPGGPASASTLQGASEYVASANKPADINFGGETYKLHVLKIMNNIATIKLFNNEGEDLSGPLDVGINQERFIAKAAIILKLNKIENEKGSFSIMELKGPEGLVVQQGKTEHFVYELSGKKAGYSIALTNYKNAGGTILNRGNRNADFSIIDADGKSHRFVNCPNDKSCEGGSYLLTWEDAGSNSAKIKTFNWNGRYG